jgi:hypothetical protein
VRRWNDAVNVDAWEGEGLAGHDKYCGEVGGRPRGARDVSCDWGRYDGDGVKMGVGGYKFVK